MLARTLAAQLPEVDAVSVERGRRVVVPGRWEDLGMLAGHRCPRIPSPFWDSSISKACPRTVVRMDWRLGIALVAVVAG